jgi:hypothetical protein
MKAISIRQPWASLIVAGVKPVENRSWRTRYRGPVLIHASSRMTRPDFDDAIRFLTRQFGAAAVTSWLPSYCYLREMRGGIIGRVVITDCVATHPSKWFTGPYAFVFADPEPMHFTPCYGRLGFFNPILP